jgi:alanyl-tRNA synthetase
LRFDFSHFSKLTDKELQEVQDFVNRRIRGKLDLNEHRNISIETALKNGAMALFGEKYGDTVRMIEFGTSKELCGGTHVKNTSDIWHFKITQETAIASGIRRIEAITNDAAKDYYTLQDIEFVKLKQNLKNPISVLKSVTNIQEENTKLKKQIEVLMREKAKFVGTDLENKIEEINGVNFLATTLDLDAPAIKNLMFDLGNKIDNLFFIAGTKNEDKALLTCYISKNLVADKGLDAGKVVRELGKLIHGGGGGQPFFATAGGRNPEGIDTALERAKSYL